MHGPVTDQRGPSPLDSLQHSWGIAPAAEPQPHEAPRAEPAEQVPPVRLPETPAPRPVIDYPDYNPSRPGCSCEEAGRKLLGHVSADIDADVARLEEIMRTSLIRPHRHEGGGAGFSYPWSGPGRDKAEPLIGEFSRLFFSIAGDVIISRYWRRMDVIPFSLRNRPNKVRLWPVDEARPHGSGRVLSGA